MLYMKKTCAEDGNLDPKLSSLHDDQSPKSSNHQDKDQEQVLAATDDHEQVPLRRTRVSVRARSEAPMVCGLINTPKACRNLKFLI